MKLKSGIHYGLSFPEYCSLDAVNASVLNNASKSMAHVRAALDGELGKDTPALRFGRAFHCRLLEPQDYSERFRIAGPCAAETKSGKVCGNTGSILAKDGQWYCGVKGHAPEDAPKFDGEFITNEERDRIERMREAVARNQGVSLIRARGGCEATAIWKWDATWCKARYDKLALPSRPGSSPCVVDLKKVPSGEASYDAVQWQIKKYRYDEKAAWYVDGAEEITGDKHEFIWIFVEDDVPFGVTTVKADRRTLEIGRQKYRHNWGKMLRAKKSNIWEGYPSEIQIGGLPDKVKDEWSYL